MILSSRTSRSRLPLSVGVAALWVIGALILTASDAVPTQAAPDSLSGPDSPCAEAAESLTFADVPCTHPHYDDIEALYQAEYTSGCGTNPLRFCPEQAMNRAESAVFVERGIHSATYTPPAPASQVFADLPPDSWAANWVNGLWLDAYTAG